MVNGDGESVVVLLPSLAVAIVVVSQGCGAGGRQEECVSWLLAAKGEGGGGRRQSRIRMLAKFESLVEEDVTGTNKT